MSQTDDAVSTLKRTPVTVLHWPILLASMGFFFIEFGLPIYGKELGASALEIGGLFSVFAAVVVVLRPFVGWGIDRLGRKPFFVVALALYAGAMFLFSRASDLTGLFLARMAQGLGSSFLWIAAYTIATDLAPSGERGVAVGRVDEAAARGAFYGAIAGFALFSTMAPDVGWPVVFTAYAVVAAVGAWLGWRSVPETGRAASAPAKPKVGKDRWFFSAPLLRLMVVVFTTGASSAMVWPIYLIFLQDRFAPEVGTLAAVYIPAGIVYSYLPSRLGRLSDRYGRTRLMAIGLVGSGVVSLLLPRLSSLVWLGVLFTLEAVGWTIAAPAEEAMVADLTGKSIRGRGYGVYTLARMLGATFGPLVGGWLYDSVGQAVPFYINGIVLLLGALWVLVALKQVRPIEAAA